MKFVFLSYLNRSGSTYLANLLSRSPEICVCPEAEIFYKLFLIDPSKVISDCMAKNYIKILQGNFKFSIWRIPVEIIIKEGITNFQTFLNLLFFFRNKHYPKTGIILFKHNNLNCLAEGFEDSSRILHINLVRDPRGIFASQKSTVSPATKHVMSSNPLSFADSWNSFADRVSQLTSNKNSILVRYEELLLYTEKTLQTLFGFLGLKQRWDEVKYLPSELNFWISGKYCQMHRNINEGPKTEFSEKWKNILTERDIRILSLIIQNKLGYQINTENKPNRSLFLIPLKIRRKICFWRGKWQDRHLKKLVYKSC